jgi:hypothetical protein
MIGSRVYSDEQFQGTTEKPFKGYIRDWRIVEYAVGSCVWGVFDGHDRFDGKFGHTSRIVSKKDSDGYWEIETLNSRYRLEYMDECIPLPQ